MKGAATSSPRHPGITSDNLMKHNNQDTSSTQSMDSHQLHNSGSSSSDVYNYGISGGNLPPMAAPLSARSITDCDSLFEEMLKSGTIFSPMAGSLSGGTPYGFASTSGLNGNIIANAANKERKGSFEEFMSPNGKPGKAGGNSQAGSFPPPVGLMRGNSMTRSARGGAGDSTGHPQPSGSSGSSSGSGSGSNSPTSRAMGMMRPMIFEYEKILLQERIAKRQQETKSQIHTGSYGIDEVIPLQMLPYFRWLNESAQRSLLQQLIERFQRTSYTPRYATISTPVHGMTSGLGDKNSNQDADLDPDCFDKIAGPSTGKGGADGSEEKQRDEMEVDTETETETEAELKSNTVSNAKTVRGETDTEPDHPGGSTGTGTDTEAAAASSSSSERLPSPPPQPPLLRNTSSSASMFDDAAIEAAVAVAMQLASHSSSAEQILQILTGNANSNNGNSGAGGGMA